MASTQEDATAVEAAAPAEQQQQQQEQKEQESQEMELGGELLYCGTTAWDTVGRNKQAHSKNIISPSRLGSLKDVPIASVASGSASAHCIAIGVDGRCFTWGRNEKGQLGHGDTVNRDAPVPVAALAQYKIVKAGAGRQHTVVVAADGSSYAYGFNKHGQLGCGHNKEEVESLPLKCLVDQATNTYCGADFSVWLSSVEGATILTAGLPQHGQLGHGTDNEYNTKSGSVKLAYEAQPKPRAIAAFSEKRITKVACGNNHTVAVDSDGFVYTWGFGGHGRLGHKEQKDEFAPRLVEVFQKQNVLPPTAVVAAGAAFSACTAGAGQLYMWGRVKSTGDNWMYPKPVLELSEATIRSMDCGNTTTVVAADKSCISWGTASYGELGYGATGPKSSANPKEIEALEGMQVLNVACGLAHTLYVVSRSSMGDKLAQFDVFDPETNNNNNSNVSAEEEESQEEEAPPKGKRKAKPAASGGRGGRGAAAAAAAAAAASRRPARKKAKKKYSSDEDDDEEEVAEESPEDDDFDTEEESDDDSEDDYMSEESDSPPRRGRGRGRGTPRTRGRGRKNT